MTKKQTEEYKDRLLDLERGIYSTKYTLRLLSNVFEEYTNPTEGLTLDEVNEVLGLLQVCQECLAVQDERIDFLQRKLDQPNKQMRP